MSVRFFGAACLVLAVLFTLATVKGLLTNNFSVVLTLPAIAAIALIIIGIGNFKRT